MKYLIGENIRLKYLIEELKEISAEYNIKIITDLINTEETPDGVTIFLKK